MVTWDDVEEIAGSLPEAHRTEGHGHWGGLAWLVGEATGKRKPTAFAWERGLTKADIKRYGDQPIPEGPLLGLRVADLTEKEAVLDAEAPACFTIPHFDGWPAVLLQLEATDREQLRRLVTDAWLCSAPERLTGVWLAAGR